MEYVDKLRKQRGVFSGFRNGQHKTQSAADRLIINQSDCVHKIKAKDSTDRWAYYFVYVEKVREALFLRSLRAGVCDLEDYGKVIASNYGEKPSDEVVDELLFRFGWDVSEVEK